MSIQNQTENTHTIAVLVDNEPGVLARVIGLFSGRGYNIESLTVAETDAEAGVSRITVVTSGTPMIIEKIKPDEIYNFADQDHVGWSFEIPAYSFRITSLSVI